VKTEPTTAVLKQIGVIHSPYSERKDAPFQGKHEMKEATIELFEAYEPGLLDIESCTHLHLLYWQDKGDRKNPADKNAMGSGHTWGLFHTLTQSSQSHRDVCRRFPGA
jgi:tRNA (adenine37-N6)-methyltransferase